MTNGVALAGGILLVVVLIVLLILVILYAVGWAVFNAVATKVDNAKAAVDAEYQNEIVNPSTANLAYYIDQYQTRFLCGTAADNNPPIQLSFCPPITSV